MVLLLSVLCDIIRPDTPVPTLLIKRSASCKTQVCNHVINNTVVDTRITLATRPYESSLAHTITGTKRGSKTENPEVNVRGEGLVKKQWRLRSIFFKQNEK